jgi:hypothetical protein
VPFEGDFTVPVEPKEIEKFCKRHDAVRGDVIVGPTYPHRDLSSLSCIHSIGGRLVIKKTPALERLDGLALDRMGGVPLAALRLVDNPSLVDVSALARTPDLRIARLVIEGNERLQTVAKLPDIVSGSDVIVVDNVALVELDAPNGARRTTRLGEVHVANNPRLVRVSGLDRVVGAEVVSVKENARLRALHGLERLIEVGSWELVGHPLLVDWKAAPMLSVVGDFEVRGCDGLEALPGLPDLNRVASIHIADNTMLSSVAGLTVSRLGHPTVDELVVTGNPRLSARATGQLVERLHLPIMASAVRIDGNGAALREAPSDGRSRPDADAPAAPVPDTEGLRGD